MCKENIISLYSLQEDQKGGDPFLYAHRSTHDNKFLYLNLCIRYFSYTNDFKNRIIRKKHFLRAIFEGWIKSFRR